MQHVQCQQYSGNGGCLSLFTANLGRFQGNVEGCGKSQQEILSRWYNAEAGEGKNLDHTDELGLVQALLSLDGDALEGAAKDGGERAAPETKAPSAVEREALESSYPFSFASGDTQEEHTRKLQEEMMRQAHGTLAGQQDDPMVPIILLSLVASSVGLWYCRKNRKQLGRMFQRSLEGRQRAARPRREESADTERLRVAMEGGDVNRLARVLDEVTDVNPSMLKRARNVLAQKRKEEKAQQLARSKVKAAKARGKASKAKKQPKEEKHRGFYGDISASAALAATRARLQLNTSTNKDDSDSDNSSLNEEADFADFQDVESKLRRRRAQAEEAKQADSSQAAAHQPEKKGHRRQKSAIASISRAVQRNIISALRKAPGGNTQNIGVPADERMNPRLRTPAMTRAAYHRQAEAAQRLQYPEAEAPNHLYHHPQPAQPAAHPSGYAQAGGYGAQMYQQQQVGGAHGGQDYPSAYQARAQAYPGYGRAQPQQVPPPPPWEEALPPPPPKPAALHLLPSGGDQSLFQNNQMPARSVPRADDFLDQLPSHLPTEEHVDLPPASQEGFFWPTSRALEPTLDAGAIQWSGHNRSSSTDWNTAATNLLAANVASSRLSKETTDADNMAESGEWLAESLIASLAAD